MGNIFSKRIIRLNHQMTFLLLSVVIPLMTTNDIYSQETEYKSTSIKTGAGIGINEGKRETGIGMVYSIGWQKSYGKKNRLRLNPNIMLGSFRTYTFPTDTREQLYKVSSCGINIHYDLFKGEAVSLVTSGGGFVNYSRGLLGTGGWPEENNNRSEYFHTIYFGANASIGLRIDSKKSRLAYEIRPINIHLGNKGFVLGYLMFVIDFKLKK